MRPGEKPAAAVLSRPARECHRPAGDADRLWLFKSFTAIPRTRCSPDINVHGAGNRPDGTVHKGNLNDARMVASSVYNRVGRYGHGKALASRNKIHVVLNAGIGVRHLCVGWK